MKEFGWFHDGFLWIGSMNDNDDNLDEADRAIADRLAKLGRAPVDTSGLKSRVESLLDKESNGASDPVIGTVPAARRWRVPVAWAALFLVGAVLAAFLWLQPASQPTGQPYTITPVELANIHAHYHEHGKSLTAVKNVGDANAEMIKQWAGAPRFPELAGIDIETCCLYELSSCRVTCLHLKSNGHDVTLVVGNARDLRLSDAQVVQSQGRQLTVGTAGSVHVVSPSDPERFVALVSSMPRADLTNLALTLRH